MSCTLASFRFAVTKDACVLRFHGRFAHRISDLSDLNIHHQLHRIHVKCPSSLKKSSRGLLLNIAYLDVRPLTANHQHHVQQRRTDTAIGHSANLPIVLYLCGFIGSHRPVSNFLQMLANATQSRVIAPLWPGLSRESHGVTKRDDDLLGHHSSEFAEICMEFLKAIHISPKRIPLQAIVAHSGGCNKALLLMSLNSSVKLARSLTLVCPSGPYPLSMPPYTKIHELVANGWDVKFLRPFLAPFMVTCSYFSPFRGINLREAAALGQATHRVETGRILSAAAEVMKSEIPLRLIYTDNDEFVPERSTFAIACELGLDPKTPQGQQLTEVVEIENKYNIVKRYGGDHLANCRVAALRISKGGTHWPHRHVPNLVIEKVIELATLTTVTAK